MCGFWFDCWVGFSVVCFFREKLEHYNVTFNENGTLSYVAKRSAIFLPEMNSIDLNATLVTPNLALLVSLRLTNQRNKLSLFFLREWLLICGMRVS